MTGKTTFNVSEWKPDRWAVWLWSALTERNLPIISLDARHAHGVLKMMPNKTDRHDARGLAGIVRTGWFKAVQIKSHDAYVHRAMLTAREALVGMRVRLENEIRGLLKTFGVIFGKRVGGFKRRAGEILDKELSVAPNSFLSSLPSCKRGEAS